MSEINPVLYQNELGKFSQIQQDYEEVKKRVDKENKLSSIFDVCPIFRRVERVPDKIEADDYIPAAGLVSLAVLNAPEDENVIAEVRKQVNDVMANYPLFAY